MFLFHPISSTWLVELRCAMEPTSAIRADDVHDTEAIVYQERFRIMELEVSKLSSYINSSIFFSVKSLIGHRFSKTQSPRTPCTMGLCFSFPRRHHPMGMGMGMGGFGPPPRRHHYGGGMGMGGRGFGHGGCGYSSRFGGRRPGGGFGGGFGGGRGGGFGRRC